MCVIYYRDSAWQLHLFNVQSFGGLDAVEVDPTNGSNLIFTFRNSSSANQVWKQAISPMECVLIASPFQVVKSSSTFQGKPLIMKWYTPKARQSSLAPTVTSSVSPLSYLQNSKGHTPMPAVERQESEVRTMQCSQILKKMNFN